MLSRDLLKAATQILNPKALHGWCSVALVDYEASVFVVTDGCMLVEIKTAEIKKAAKAAGVKGRYCFTSPELKAAVMVMRKSDSLNCTRAALEKMGIDLLSPADARNRALGYPDYTRVIPEDAKPEDIGVFGLYAAKYIKALEDIEHSGAVMNKWYHLPASRTGMLKVVFDCYDDMTITAILMPLNIEHDIRNKGARK